jgi:plasmid stabilization system protein ParE
MARVVWTRAAVRDLAHIEAYVNDFNPYAAKKLSGRLVAACESLVDNPMRGRPAAANRGELTVVRPYVIRYSLEAGSVVIRESATALDGLTEAPNN